jgi:hypothetical protein
MCCVAGHYEKRNWRAVPAAEGDDFLRVDLKETLAAYRSNGIQAFGQVRSEPRPLPSGNEENGSFAASQDFLAYEPKLWVVCGLCIHGYRFNLVDWR